MMSKKVFTIDGVAFDLSVISLKRKFSVTDTENSGRTTDMAMHRDIGGTFYNYEMQIERSRLDTDSYDQFYDIISTPVESHDLTFPYNQETLSFKAYVTNGEDTLMIRKGTNYWSGLTVNFVAMEPQRRL